MDIRKLGPEDAEAFAAVRLEALKNDPDAFGSTYDDEKYRPMEEWRARLSPGNEGENGYFGAFADGEIVGTIGYFRHKGTKARHKAAIVSMYVRQDHRGTGMAAGLMQAALEYLKGLGDIDQVQLAVVSSNPAAVRFYEKMGFQVYGLEKRALKAGNRFFDETHMYLLL